MFVVFNCVLFISVCLSLSPSLPPLFLCACVRACLSPLSLSITPNVRRVCVFVCTFARRLIVRVLLSLVLYQLSIDVSTEKNGSLFRFPTNID